MIVSFLKIFLYWKRCLAPNDVFNIYMFLSKSRNGVKILYYERDFCVLYEKHSVVDKFEKPAFDEVFKCDSDTMVRHNLSDGKYSGWQDVYNSK